MLHLPTAPPSERLEDVRRVAAELFAEAGYEGLNLDAVARRAGVSRSWLYGHFPDRRALLASVIDLHASAFMEKIAVALRPGHDVDDLLRDGFEMYVDYVAERRSEYLVLFGPAASLEPEVGSILTDLRDRLATAYVELFRPALEAQGVDWPSDQEARLVAISMIALAEGAVLAWLTAPAMSREHLVETTVAAIRRGILGPLR